MVTHFCTFTNYRASSGPQPAECIPSEKCLLGFQQGVSARWKYECSEWTASMKQSFIPLRLNELLFGAQGIFLYE